MKQNKNRDLSTERGKNLDRSNENDLDLRKDQGAEQKKTSVNKDLNEDRSDKSLSDKDKRGGNLRR